jgi:hypothetical protein
MGWTSRRNRGSSRSWHQTPRLPAKSCGPTSMTLPAGTTAGRQPTKRSTLHCASPQHRPGASIRRVPRCPSAWRCPRLRGDALAAGKGRRGQTALCCSCSPRPWVRRPPHGRAGEHRSRARSVSAASGHPPRPRRIPPAVCHPRLRGGARLQRRPVRRALVGKALGLVAARAKAAPRKPILGLRDGSESRRPTAMWPSEGSQADGRGSCSFVRLRQRRLQAGTLG